MNKKKIKKTMKKTLITSLIILLFNITLTASNILNNEQELKNEIRKSLYLKEPLEKPSYVIIKFNIDDNGNFKLLEVGPVRHLKSKNNKLNKHVENKLKDFNKKCLIESKDYIIKITFKKSKYI